MDSVWQEKSPTDTDTAFALSVRTQESYNAENRSRPNAVQDSSNWFVLGNMYKTEFH